MPRSKPADASARRSEPVSAGTGGPLAGWGLEMPYSVGCQRADCNVDSSAKHSEAQRPSLDIVVAARDQPLGKLVRTLLDALPLVRLRPPVLWVYHKGKPKTRELAELAAATAGVAQLRLALGLPNAGRAEHTCVHHVVQNYARLADLTLFLKDTALAHAHLGVATRLLAFAQRLPMDVDAWCARPPVAVNLSFALDSYQSETCWRFGRCYGNESWKRANVRPFGAWLRSHGTAPVRNMPRGQVQACYGGFFAASRRAVQATPQRTYAAIEEELTQADSLEEGHYMERTWPTAFGLQQPLHPRFVRVGIYTAVCGSGGTAHNHTSMLWQLPKAAEEIMASSALRVPPEYLEPACATCGPVHQAWLAGRASMLRFLFFSDRARAIAEADRHGWTGVLVSSSACRPRDLKMRPEAARELRGFDYTAYLPPTAAASEAISLGGVLHIATNHLGLGPSVALLARRRGGLDAIRSAERSFLARYSASGRDSNRSHSASGRGGNRSLLTASAVIRRSSSAARSFSDRWQELARDNPHVREQFCLDVLLQAQPESVVVVDVHTVKHLVYHTS